MTLVELDLADGFRDGPSDADDRELTPPSKTSDNHCSRSSSGGASHRTGSAHAALKPSSGEVDFEPLDTLSELATGTNWSILGER